GEFLSLDAEGGPAVVLLPLGEDRLELFPPALGQEIVTAQLAPDAVAPRPGEAAQLVRPRAEPEAIEGELGKRLVPSRKVLQEGIDLPAEGGDAALPPVRAGDRGAVEPGVPLRVVEVIACIGRVGLLPRLLLDEKATRLAPLPIPEHVSVPAFPLAAEAAEVRPAIGLG